MVGATEYGRSPRVWQLGAFRGMGVKWWRVVLVAIGAVALTILFAHRADAASGTDVCGTLPVGQTTWDALGSPYRICDGGVGVPSGSTLTLDGSLGSVQVQAQGHGGVTVNGAIETHATSPAAEIFFDGPMGQASGPWDGITSPYEPGNCCATSDIRYDLAYVDMAHSVGIAAGFAGSANLDHISVHDHGAIEAIALVTSVTNSMVSNGYGIRVGCPGLASPPAAASTTVESNVVDTATYGIDAATCGALVVRHNRIFRTGLDPTAPNVAMRVDSGQSTVGPEMDIDDNEGSGNKLDVLELDGIVNGGFTWLTPTNSTTLHPLGYTTTYLRDVGPGTVTIPANSVVKGYLELKGANIDASQPGSVFTSPDDNSVGVPVCSGVYLRCQPSANDGLAAGVGLIGPGVNATFVGAAVRYGGLKVDGADTSNPLSTLSVRDSTITDAATGITAGNRVALSVEGGSIARMLHDGIAAGVAEATIAGVSLKDIGTTGFGIGVTVGSTDGPISVTDVTVSRAGQGGISVGSDSGRVTVRDNRVTDSGRTSAVWPSPWPAITAIGHLTLGPGGDVVGNSGSGNGLEVIVLRGSVSNSFSWITPTTGATDHPLGYAAFGTLTLGPGAVMTVPKDAILKFEPADDDPSAPGLLVAGGAIDASAGGSTWTSWWDESIGPVTCDGSGCSTNLRWGGIQLTADGFGAKGNARLVGATVRGGQVDFSSGASSTFGDASHGFAVDSSTFDDSFVNIGTTGARIDGSRIGGTIALDGLDYGVITAGVGSTMTCDTITNNYGGIDANGDAYPFTGTSLTIAQSNIFGNRKSPAGVTGHDRPDLEAAGKSNSEGAVIARSNWWGQSGGPVPGQIDTTDRVDASTPLDQPSSCAPSPGYPEAPMGVTAAAGNGSALVQWSAPEDVGGGPIRQYTVTISPGNTTTTVDGSTTQTTVTGLTNGTTYTFTVRATNDFGDSAESTPSNSVTPAVPPPPPPHSNGGFIVDDWGGLHPYGTGSFWPPAIFEAGPYWPGQDVVRGIASLATGGGYVVDDWGGIHTFTAYSGVVDIVHGGPYWPGQDVVRGIALLPDDSGGYVLDDWGGLHAFGVGSHPAPPLPKGGPYWAGIDAARGVTILPDGSGGYVVDAWGGLHPFVIPGSGHTMPPKPMNGPYWPGQNVVRGVAADAEGNGGYVLDDWGGVHTFSIPGTSGNVPTPNGGPYWPGQDVTRGISVVP